MMIVDEAPKRTSGRKPAWYLVMSPNSVSPTCTGEQQPGNELPVAPESPIHPEWLAVAEDVDTGEHVRCNQRKSAVKHALVAEFEFARAVVVDGELAESDGHVLLSRPRGSDARIRWRGRKCSYKSRTRLRLHSACPK